MRAKRLMGVGAVLAALASPLASSAAWAQQTPDNTAFLNETIDNKGLPHQAPSIGLPAIYGLNPCATGAAAGISTPLFGISGAISNIDRECETRNNAAVAVTAIKDPAVAREIMCNVKDFREAALRVGKPCLADQPRPVAAAAPAATPAAATPTAAAVPVAAIPTLAIPAVAAATSPASPAAAAPPVLLSDAPAFCHRPDLNLTLYPDCTSHAAQASTQADAADQRAAHRIYYGYGRERRAMRREALRRPLPERAVPASPAAQPSAPQDAVPLPVSASASSAPAHAGCTVPSALGRLYPDCNGSSAADATPIPAAPPATAPAAPQAASYVGIYTTGADGTRVFSIAERAALARQPAPSQGGGE